MKKTAILIALIVTAFAGKGQNLVLNGDFELYSGCPNDLNQVDSALYWYNPAGGTPDYYNQCAAGTYAGVPGNYLGYQYARNGTGYAGFHRWVQIIPNYREYIEGTLTTLLTAGTCYHLEMYINLANRSRFTSTNVGVYFSDTLITGILSQNVLPYIPQINNTSTITPDTLNWTLVSENFTANGGENYFIIGNFNPDSLTDTVLYNSQSGYHDSYIDIDDICLVPCGSSSCATAIEEQNKNEAFSIYPNPVKDQLFIKSNSFTGEEEIIITDILGKEIYRNQITSSNFKFQVSNFQPGIYFIEINTGKNIYRKKFLKQ